MKNIVIVSYLLFSMIVMNSCNSQVNDSSEIQNFLNDVINPDIQIDEVINRNLLLDEMSDATLSEKKSRDSLNRKTLSGLRANLLKCENVEYRNFSTLEKGDANELIKDFMGIEDKSKAFFVLCDKNPVVPILVKEGKIASFMTMSKGGKKYFLEW